MKDKDGQRICSAKTLRFDFRIFPVGRTLRKRFSWSDIYLFDRFKISALMIVHDSSLTWINSAMSCCLVYIPSSRHLVTWIVTVKHDKDTSHSLHRFLLTIRGRCKDDGFVMFDDKVTLLLIGTRQGTQDKATLSNTDSGRMPIDACQRLHFLQQHDLFLTVLLKPGQTTCRGLCHQILKACLYPSEEHRLRITL